MSANEGSLLERQRARIGAEIRRAAYRPFIQRGYDAVTTEEIAAAAGVSPCTSFGTFPPRTNCRSDLLDRLTRRWCDSSRNAPRASRRTSR
jgi:hypothetical protein